MFSSLSLNENNILGLNTILDQYKHFDMLEKCGLNKISALKFLFFKDASLVRALVFKKAFLAQKLQTFKCKVGTCLFH